ncbi:MAG: GTPase HflX [Chloroflexi bacterium]|nr:GTPase HflX [Chloroflexota bacterium]
MACTTVAPSPRRSEDKIGKRSIATHPEAERAVLVGAVVKGRQSPWGLGDSLEELGQLALSAGAKVVGQLSQHLDRPTPWYLGQGKLEELKKLRQDQDYTVAIFDDELTPAQQRNLEEALEVKVIDRSALILDVFARQAMTREGQLQVELAQHQYLLPRLRGQWAHLERLGGGIGTRGPGETQLETDRRLTEGRIKHLREQLDAVRRHRELYRQRRQAMDLPVVSLVGYTNAGKSTLFNALCRASVRAEARLFSTLDPITRRLALPTGRPVLLTDTVGFIHKLPPTVVAAFRATLEELAQADLLLHMVDISHRNAAEQAQVVEQTLEEMGLEAKPRLLVLNKVDLILSEEAASREDLVLEGFQGPGTSSVLVSAAKGWGLLRLLQEVEGFFAKRPISPGVAADGWQNSYGEGKNPRGKGSAAPVGKAISAGKVAHNPGITRET